MERYNAENISMDDFENIRQLHPQTFNKYETIKLNNKTPELPESARYSNPLDEIRIHDFLREDPLPRQIGDPDEMAALELEQYGPKVNISTEKLIQDFQSKIMTVYKYDRTGRRELDPITRLPIQIRMSLFEVLQSSRQSFDVLQQLLTNIDLGVNGNNINPGVAAQLQALIVSSGGINALINLNVQQKSVLDRILVSGMKSITGVNLAEVIYPAIPVSTDNAAGILFKKIRSDHGLLSDSSIIRVANITTGNTDIDDFMKLILTDGSADYMEYEGDLKIDDEVDILKYIKKAHLERGTPLLSSNQVLNAITQISIDSPGDIIDTALIGQPLISRLSKGNVDIMDDYNKNKGSMTYKDLNDLLTGKKSASVTTSKLTAKPNHNVMDVKDEDMLLETVNFNIIGKKNMIISDIMKFTENLSNKVGYPFPQVNSKTSSMAAFSIIYPYMKSDENLSSKTFIKKLKGGKKKKGEGSYYSAEGAYGLLYNGNRRLMFYGDNNIGLIKS